MYKHLQTEFNNGIHYEKLQKGYVALRYAGNIRITVQYCQKKTW